MTLADAVVLAHLAYVAFVVQGYLTLPVGWVLGWRWVRNRHYRRLHVAAIALVAVEAAVGWVCPLTWLESALRGHAEAGTFVGRLVHAVLFYDLPPWVFTAGYLAATALALALYRLLPPAAAGGAAAGAAGDSADS